MDAVISKIEYDLRVLAAGMEIVTAYDEPVRFFDSLLVRVFIEPGTRDEETDCCGQLFRLVEQARKRHKADLLVCVYCGKTSWEKVEHTRRRLIQRYPEET